MEEKKFGEFEEIKDEAQQKEQELDEQGVPIRVKLPRKGEFIGKVMQRLGGNRMNVKATDGKSRNCRVPGRFKRRFWLRPGDIVIITPWPDDNNKGDIIFQYNKNAVHQLRKKRFLNNLQDEF